MYLLPFFTAVDVHVQCALQLEPLSRQNWKIGAGDTHTCTYTKYT